MSQQRTSKHESSVLVSRRLTVGTVGCLWSDGAVYLRTLQVEDLGRPSRSYRSGTGRRTDVCRSPVWSACVSSLPQVDLIPRTSEFLLPRPSVKGKVRRRRTGLRGRNEETSTPVDRQGGSADLWGPHVSMCDRRLWQWELWSVTTLVGRPQDGGRHTNTTTTDRDIYRGMELLDTYGDPLGLKST